MPTQLNLEKLLHTVNLVTLVEASTTLTARAGRGEWRGKCPIHGGKNGSAFQIYQGDNGHKRWRCWSECNTGGNAIGYVMATENLGFIEAVKWLAEYAHLSMDEIGFTPEAAQAAAELRQRTDILDLAAEYFAAQLWSEAGKDALAYVRGRGFTDDVIRLSGWGYSDSGTGLRDYLEKIGTDLVLVRKTGLVRKDGRDFTANADGDKAASTGWLIYPHRPYPGVKMKACQKCDNKTWHDGDTCLAHNPHRPQLSGVTYFSARALDPVNPKDKSRNLPGPRQLYKAEVPGVREVILCEGPADAESARQLGKTAWALCGLGTLPEDDLRQLQQRPVVYLALDGDKAGQQAQAKIALALGPLTMLVDPFEDYKDINALLQAGGDAERISTQLEASTPLLDQRLQQSKIATPHKLQQITGEILAMLKQLPKELEPRYLQKTQSALGMSRKELRALMRGAEQKQADDAAPILSSVKDGSLAFLGEPLGNFNARITHEQTVDDGMNLPEVQYTLRGKLAAGPPLPEVTIQADEFAEMKWISRYWGARPIPYLAKGKYYLLARAIQEISLAEMIQEKVHTFTGWADVDGARAFLSASGCISAAGFDDTVRVDLGENNRRHYALPAPPMAESKALAVAVHASLDFLKLGPLHVTAPIWAAMFAGPFTEVFPLYGLIWFYGATQSGKSTVAHLALTHFGAGFIRGRQYNAPQDWISTITAMEQVMFSVKDAPVILDDFAPQFADAGSARRMHQMAHTIVRSVGNRSARARSTRDLKERKTRIPRGIVIVTAELPLTGESTVGRMIYVPINRGEVLPDPGNGETSRPALDQAQDQAEAGLYAQAMSAYVQWLAANWERAIQNFKEIMDESSKLARKRGRLQNRLPDYYALLDAAQQVALMAFHELGVLSAQEAGQIAHDNSAAILGVIENQAERIAAESPVRKFFEALDNLLERRKVYLAPKTSDPHTPFVPPADADLIGYFDPKDEQVVYLNDGACLAHAREHWARLGENFDTTTDALRRQFSQVSELLYKRGDGRNLTVSVWAGGKTRRMLAINTELVMNLYGVTLKNEQQVTPLPADESAEIGEK